MVVCCLRLPFVTLFLLLICTNVNSHSHRNNLNRERESDGAFSPKDKDHFVDGEHHSEFDHEAVLGSKNVAEEFEQLSSEEAKKRLKLLVEKMDKNQDGVVDMEELVNWVLRSFKMLSQEESQERLEENDSNDDGKVTWKEYIAETYGMSNDIDNENLAEEQKMLKEDEELFQATDMNKDGYLDKDEFLAFTHPEEHDHTLKIIYKRTMDEKDEDKDGLITFQEFVGMEGRGHDKEWLLSEKDRFDNDFDKDRDGKLNKLETLLWLVPNNKEAAEQEANHLIENADDNMDGALTEREILDHHDIFVGSEVTDYGNYLHDTNKFIDEL